jgi:N-acetylglucosaminyl-diphospho-decaprenol L-rhamnosyltransferase
MTVSVVIPNRDGAAVLPRCLDALAAAGGLDETIVVDDGSCDGSDLEAERRGATLLRSPGRGFAAAVNHGVAHSRACLVLLLNSDAFVGPDTVRLLAEPFGEDPRLGLCGAALVHEDGSRARSAGRCLTLGHALRLNLGLPPAPPPEGRGLAPTTFAPLACVLVRREAWDDVGGLDERFHFYFEDHDLCWRLAERGWRLAVRWDAQAVHREGGSSRARSAQRWFPRYHESRLRYLRKRYPRAWALYLATWAPNALAHAAVWALRIPRRGREARLWAAAYLRALVAGL